MRGANQILKNKTHLIEQRVKQSQHISNRMGQIKQSNSPYLSNTNLSDGREKWFQYLPNQNHFSNNRVSSLSKEESRNDNYLHSLQRRLQKLFKEEKQMLRERHYKTGNNNNHNQTRNQNDHPQYQTKQIGQSYSIENMQRKIRQLEEKYRRQEINKQQRQDEPLPKHFEQINPRIATNTRQKQTEYNSNHKQRQKTKSQYSPTYSRDILTQSVEQCVVKQKYLQEEVELLKQSVKQIRQNNQQLLKIVHHKNQKKKHKYRTKELLQNILHKLQFINVQIKSAKKQNLKINDGKMNKIQKDARDLLQQFQLLRIQYKHLQEQRRKVQIKQVQLQNKLGKITNQNQQNSQ